MKIARNILSSAALLLVVATARLEGQVSSYSIHRQKWITQASTNPVPFAFRFSVNVTGVGTLKSGELRSPLTTNALSGGTLQLSYATNFFVLAVDGTNVNSGASLMNASYPTGAYVLTVQSKVGPATLTTNITADLSQDFPAALPVITNVTPLMGLESTQLFAWPAFSSNPLAYTRFYLLEGAVDTNLLEAVLSNGLEALTNTMSVVALELNLPASQTSLQVSGIDPAVDHLAILEFHDPAVVGGVGGVSEAGTVSGGMIFYYALRIVSEPQSQSVMEGDPATFTAFAIGSRPITYQWMFKGNPISQATNAVLFLPSVTSSSAGEYTVVVANPGGVIESAPAILTVTPPAPEEPPQLANLRVSGLDFSFEVRGGAGITYEVECTSDFASWQPLGQVASPGGTNAFTDLGAMSRPLRFYRARQVP
jgi:hypothetical protein